MIVPLLIPPTISFLYDGMGNRVRKFVSAGNKTTYYVRDASGNVMATYEKTGANGVIKQIEVPLYGSDRVGMAKPNITRNNNDNIAPTDETIFTRTLGLKMYFLSDQFPRPVGCYQPTL
ncbi:MAG: hypothetical protein JST20_04860 [Bacteroidetes bacterium]|nr:hypothetical protein [Bacteroidota bacterium]